MSYLVTARKWRPQKFSEVVGQDHVTQTIKNAIVNNRIAHAFIFAGPRGVGKTTTARILAKSLNCLNPKDGEPCNVCELCVSFANSQSFDIIEIDGASNRRIEEVRQLRESVKYAPTKGKYKVYIVDEVHMLTNESFNAFLKTLEEPPEHTIFIFATTDIHKVPLTIISRCQRFDFRRIEISDIKNHLLKIAEAENLSIDDQSLTVISKKADGALRDAQSLFDQVIAFCGNSIEIKIVAEMLNMIDEEIYFDLSEAMLVKDFGAAFKVSQRIYNNGWNFIDFLDGLVEHFRNVLTVVIRKDTSLIDWAEVFKDRYLSYSNRFSEGDLLRILSYLNKTSYEIKNTQNQKLKIEIALAHLIGFEKSAVLSNLIKKIEEIPDTAVSPQRLSQDPVPEKKNEILENPPPKQKEVESQPPPKNKEIPTPELDKSVLTIDIVKSRWSKFCLTIQTEKLLLGGCITTSKPISLNDNVVTIGVESKEAATTLKNDVKYLAEKALEIFGFKLKFEYQIISSINNHHFGDKSNSNQDPDSVLVKALKEKLDVREIT